MHFTTRKPAPAPAGYPRCSSCLASVAVLLLCLAVSSCLSTGEAVYSAANTLLPGVRPEMNTPGFWLDGLDWADRVVLSPETVAAYNADTQNKGLTRDLAGWKSPDAASLEKDLVNTVKWLAKQDLYCPDGRKVDARFLDPLLDLMNPRDIREPVEPGFALVTESADLRVLPTVQGLFDGPRDWFIDNLQASSLEPGDACVVQHESKDGQWTYVTTAFASGWVQTRLLGFCTRDEFLAWKSAGRTWVVTAAKADYYLDPAMVNHQGSFRMGTWLYPASTGASMAQASPYPLAIPAAGSPALPSSVSPAPALPLSPAPVLSSTNPADSPAVSPNPAPALMPTGPSGASGTGRLPAATAFRIPGRDALGHLVARTVWIAREDLSDQPLDGTLRTVLHQAFRLLNSPYGWGGSFGEQDCSQFLQEIYSTLGLVLPRNSAAQAKTGQAIEGFGGKTPVDEKYGLLASQGVPGFTILRMPGHIMLYLGCREGKVWAIHATWAYREPWERSDRIRLINRVTVSSLDLGSGSTKGSHLSRLTHGMVIGPLLPDILAGPSRP